jgi:hypothetical protein
MVMGVRSGDGSVLMAKAAKNKAGSGNTARTPGGASPAKKPTPARRSTAGTGAYGQRADLGADASIYYAELDPPQRAIAKKLHALVMATVPEATCAIKWGMPVFEKNGMLCYIRARREYVTLGFYFQGTQLRDPKKLLEGSGQNMRHVKIPCGHFVPERELADLVAQAARINEELS